MLVFVRNANGSIDIPVLVGQQVRQSLPKACNTSTLRRQTISGSPITRTSRFVCLFVCLFECHHHLSKVLSTMLLLVSVRRVFARMRCLLTSPSGRSVLSESYQRTEVNEACGSVRRRARPCCHTSRFAIKQTSHENSESGM